MTLKGIDTGLSLPVTYQFLVSQLKLAFNVYMMPRILTKMENFGKHLRATHHLNFQTFFIRRTAD